MLFAEPRAGEEGFVCLHSVSGYTDPRGCSHAVFGMALLVLSPETGAFPELILEALYNAISNCFH